MPRLKFRSRVPGYRQSLVLSKRLRYTPMGAHALSWTVIGARKRASAFVLAMLAMLALSAWSAPPVCADVVVGNGTPEGCTEQALGTAIAQGGNIRFSCGVSPTVIVLTAAWVVLQDTTIDGGGMITLSGGDATELLVNTAVLNLLNLTIIHGRISTDQGTGGAVVNLNTLNVVNSVFSENRSALLGGAIKNKGTLTVSRSTFSSNTAPVGGA